MAPSSNSSGSDTVEPVLPIAPTSPLFPQWFTLTVASVLLTLFVASYVVDMFSMKYEVPAPVYGIVIVIVTGIFGSEAVKGLKK